MRSPAEILQAAFDAMNLQDWGGLGELCDPVSLRLFKEEMIEDAEETFRKSDKTGINLRGDPLDELFDDPDDLFFDPQESLSRALFEVRTLEELREMDPARVFARWVQAKNARVRRILKPDGEAWEAPEKSPSFSTAQVFSFTILGWLTDDPELAHVFYRNDREVPGAPRAHCNAIKSAADEDNELKRILCVRSYPINALCRRQDDGSWKLIASSSLYLVPSVELIDATHE